MAGFDCSGLVQELLAAAGEDPPGDQTAQALYDYFCNNGKINTWGAGSLAFYGTDLKHISHVAFCLDERVCIEAGGGDSTTTSISQAIKMAAFVRIRPIKRRKDFLVVIKPYYSKLGLIP